MGLENANDICRPLLGDRRPLLLGDGHGERCGECCGECDGVDCGEAILVGELGAEKAYLFPERPLGE